jgi:hypothetical protein
MGENHLLPFPTAVYAFVMLLPGIVWMPLHKTLIVAHDSDAVVSGEALRKNYIAIGFGALSIVSAFYYPAIALIFIMIVAIMYFIPRRYF